MGFIEWSDPPQKAAEDYRSRVLLFIVKNVLLYIVNSKMSAVSSIGFSPFNSLFEHAAGSSAAFEHGLTSGVNHGWATAAATTNLAR